MRTKLTICLDKAEAQVIHRALLSQSYNHDPGTITKVILQELIDQIESFIGFEEE